MNLAMTARRGTFVSHSSYDDSDDDDYDYSSVDRNSEMMRLYECGHAFHYQCIRKYVSEKQQEKSEFRGVQSKIKPMKVTDKLVDEQKCPWCYSDKFKVDFEPQH